MKNDTDWKNTAEFFKELKMRWIKTGPVDKEIHEELEQEFNDSIQTFFENRRHFFEGMALQAEENIKVYEALVIQAREAHDLPDAKMAFEISKRIQKEWKEAGKVPAEKRQPLWDEFSKLNNRIFSRYKRGLNPGPQMNPREILRKIDEMVEELKKNGSSAQHLCHHHSGQGDSGRLEETSDAKTKRGKSPGEIVSVFHGYYFRKGIPGKTGPQQIFGL